MVELKNITIQQVALEFTMENFTGEVPPQVWLFNSNEDTSTANLDSSQSKEDAACNKNTSCNFPIGTPGPRPAPHHVPLLETSRVLQALTPWMVPSWQLRTGWHVRMEASVVKRRFITSSFARDTVGGLSPVSHHP